MSTRCNIHFTQGAEIVANIYRHGDGYPNTDCGVLADLRRFFVTVKTHTKGGMGGPRFDDPAYLAAKFVVWQAAENVKGINRYCRQTKQPLRKRLDFISLGVVNEDASDGAYVYTIDCGNHTKRGLPRVTWCKAVHA